jgi:hypothetical protein
VFDDYPCQFFQEKRIALGFLNDHVLQMGRQCGVATRGVHHGRTVLWGQTAQGQLRCIGLVDPRRTIARAIRRQEQDGGTGQTLDE